MDAKQEFIKSIMSVLRLEHNIYTIGAIETIIERLKINDYQLFIAYLGERKSDYEKPIESIAKGVDEFYTMKLEPHKIQCKKRQDKIIRGLHGFKNFLFQKFKDNLDTSDIEKEVLKDYGKQDSSIVEHQKEIEIRRTVNSLVNDEIIRLSKNSEELIETLIVGINPQTNEKVFTEDDVNVISEIGLDKLLIGNTDLYISNMIFNYIFSKNLKPNISQQIEINEYKKIYKEDENLICDKTRKILALGLKQKEREEEILL